MPTGAVGAGGFDRDSSVWRGFTELHQETFCSCIFNKRRRLLLLLDEPLGGKCPVSHREELFTVTGSEEGRRCLYTDELTDVILLLWRVLRNAKGQKTPKTDKSEEPPNFSGMKVANL